MKGGAALTSDRYRGYLTATGCPRSSDTVNDTRWGGVIGVGLEYGFAPNWSAAIEYDHMFMQDRFITFTNNGTLAPAGDSLRQRPHSSGRRPRHRPRQLSLGRPGHRQVLMVRFIG